jgi:cell fate regulator YaaT (PSP1 superfamily)
MTLAVKRNLPKNGASRDLTSCLSLKADVELSLSSYHATEISLLGTKLEKARAALEKMSSRFKKHRLELKLIDHQFKIEN